MVTRMPRHRRPCGGRHVANRSVALRQVIATTGLLALATGVGLSATGGTYAMWTATEQTEVATVASGSTALTVGGGSSQVLADLNARQLWPGRVVTTAQPVIVENVGTTPIALTVDGVTVGENTRALADSLRLSVVEAPNCAASTPVFQPVIGYRPVALPAVLTPGRTSSLCVAVELRSSAPASVNGGSATFTIALDGEQRRG